jgi:formiminotetrahydrofolate cyclodeaminase
VKEEESMDVKKFLEKLASDTPTPGGGSASALAGALSASLIVMVAGLSLKKDKEKQKAMREIKKKALTLQKRLLLAVDEDAKSFDAVVHAFRLPRTTEKDRLVRTRAIQKAYQKATVTPQLVCNLSIQLLEYSRFLILKGNPNAISDTGVAAFLADAALAGGLLNIGINLVPVADKVFLKKMRSLMKRLAKQRNQLMGEILGTLTRVG